MNIRISKAKISFFKRERKETELGFARGKAYACKCSINKENLASFETSLWRIVEEWKGDKDFLSISENKSAFFCLSFL